MYNLMASNRNGKFDVIISNLLKCVSFFLPRLLIYLIDLLRLTMYLDLMEHLLVDHHDLDVRLGGQCAPW